MCKSNADCARGESCVRGTCTATARGWLPGLALGLLILAALISRARADFPYSAAQMAQDAKEACDEAKADASAARKKCSSAQIECNQSIKDAKKSCEGGCDSTAAAALAYCAKQDDAIIWSCRDAAFEAQKYCSRGCKNADYKTSECNAARSSCEDATAADKRKDRAC